MTQREELKPCPFCGSATEDGMGYNYHKVCCSSLACRMSNMYFTKKEWNMRAKAQAVPEGWKLVPIEPNQAQFGGMARDVIRWIPVGDRLPKYGDDCLIVAKGKCEPENIVYEFTKDKFSSDDQFVSIPDGEDYFYARNVSYWMPLPTAPEQNK